PSSLVREAETSDEGYSPDLWRKMADLGFLGIAMPAAYGGTAAGALNQAILVEAMGRRLVPSPYFATVVLSAELINAAGSESQKRQYLPGLVNGDLIATVAATEPNVGFDAGSILMPAVQEGDAFVLNGTKRFIYYAQVADLIICAARTGSDGNPQDGVSLFLVDRNTPGVTVIPLETVAYDKQFEVVFENVRVPRERVLGEVHQGWASLEWVLNKATVLQSAELVGCMEQAMEMAIEYAKTRVQFGRPIGAFQYVQNLCVDMVTQVDRTKYITYETAWKLDEGLSIDRAVHVVKAQSGEAGPQVTYAAHICHGSYPYYLEHDLQLYVKHAVVKDLHLGSARYHRNRLAEKLEL
ncbi:MAG: acyl-CoA dehydrogenase family protein, partial [Dehalococcoidia bacterium]